MGAILFFGGCVQAARTPPATMNVGQNIFAAIILFAKSGLIPRRKLVCASAAAQIRQRLQKFGIKPDGYYKFPYRTSLFD
jgi:hypothetical protein